jgi:hypothetical protein
VARDIVFTLLPEQLKSGSKMKGDMAAQSTRRPNNGRTTDRLRDVTLRHRSLPNSSWSWECTGPSGSDQRLLEAAASDVSALTDHMFWRLNADGSCPKFVSIFRTVVPERLAEHLESMADERVTDRRLQAAVTSQLRIPSLTPSHGIWPVLSIPYSTG